MPPFFAYRPPGIGYAGPPRPPDTYPATTQQRGQTGIGPYAYMSGLPKPKAPTPTKQPIVTSTPKPKPPADPWAQLLRQLMGSVNETPAQQEARVNREINAQIAAQKQLLDDEYARQREAALQQYQAMAAAGSAAAAMSGDLFNAVGGEYNAAAGEIKGLSHGLTKGVAGTTASETAAANAGLAGAGNLAVTTGGGAGSIGPGGSLQQGVEDYRAGTLGSQLFSGLGQAANFGLAGLANSDNLRATQEANAALMTATHDINAAQSKAVEALSAGRLDLYHTYMTDAQDAKVKAISLAQGIQAQQQAAKTAGFKSNLDLAKLKISAGHLTVSEKSLLARMQGQNFQQKMATIKESRLTAASQRKLENDALTQARLSGAIDVNASKADGFVRRIDGSYMLDSKGQKIPASRLGSGGTGKVPTPNQVQNQVKNWYYGTNATSLKQMPKKDSAGNPVYRRVPGGRQGQLSYQAAYRNLRVQNLTDEQARGYLDPLYGRGDRGRPYVSAAQRATLKAAGVNVNANVLPQYKGKSGKVNWVGPSKLIVAGLTPDQANKVTDRYLTPAQVEALHQSGQLPPGVWVDGSGLKDSRGFSLVRVYLISHLG